jgi:hypothetical protein
MLYAHERFGTWYDTAFSRFYMIDPNGWARHPMHGPFSLSYLPMNLWTFMFATPDALGHFPFFKPHLYGQALWTISPAFIIALAAPWNKSETWFLWLAALLVMLPSMFVFTNGQEQFGFRYAIMAYPFLLLLMHRGWMGSQLDKALVGLSIVLTFTGMEALRFA